MVSTVRNVNTISAFFVVFIFQWLVNTSLAIGHDHMGDTDKGGAARQSFPPEESLSEPSGSPSLKSIFDNMLFFDEILSNSQRGSIISCIVGYLPLEKKMDLLSAMGELSDYEFTKYLPILQAMVEVFHGDKDPIFSLNLAPQSRILFWAKYDITGFLEKYRRSEGEPLYEIPARLDIRASKGSNLQSVFNQLARVGVSEIIINGRVETAGIRDLLDSHLMEGLQSLELEDSGLDSKKIQTLAGSDKSRNLRNLNLSHNPIGPEGARAISQSENLEKLERLDLCNTGIGFEGCLVIRNSSKLTKLQCLDLSSNKTTAKGVEKILEWPLLTQLRELGLGSNGVDDTCAMTIANSSALPELRILKLVWNDIMDTGAVAIASSQRLGKLKVLDLRCNVISEKGVAKLDQLYFGRPFQLLRVDDQY